MHLLRVLQRLWLIGSCDHHNKCMAMIFEDTTELRICRGCGLVVRWADEGTDRNNPHMRWTGAAANLPNEDRSATLSGGTLSDGNGLQAH